MKVKDIYSAKTPAFSFEFFPPKTPEAEEKLFETVQSLKPLAPAFVSVTYGAMGSTRHNTLRIVSKIKHEIGIEAAAHLTCVGHGRSEIEKILSELAESGIENIVALRGDPPKGESQYKPAVDGFCYAAELVRFIHEHPRFSSAFSLAVAGYPEGHVQCRDLKMDLEHLKYKVDGGADAVITQLFFDNRDYFDFVNRARLAGISIPIVPGIMPVTLAAQLEKFSVMCGSKIPPLLNEAIRRFKDDQSSVESFGIEYATRQCEELLKAGVPGLHFYTLNKSHATRQICMQLGLVQKSDKDSKW